MIGVISDSHLHNWSVFSKSNKDGVNDRLQYILDEVWRAAETAKAAGAKSLIHCGDMFHVRGSVAPSVLNPTLDLFARITSELGLSVYALAGNHDLEGQNANSLGNAAEALAGAGVYVVSEPLVDSENKRILIPYYHSINKLREIIEDACEGDKSDWSLFLHAPMNGVIAGIPDNGLSVKEMQELGFKAVFCGHYHAHKVFEGNVCSVGSLTHQTFGDIGTKSGFLLFDGEEIVHYPSSAPRFTDFDPEWDEIEMIEQCEGNYVRARLEGASNAEVEEVREYLKGQGAAGIQIVHVPKPEASREGELSVEAGKSMRVSLSEWCKKKGFDERVQESAQEIMDAVEAKHL